MIAFERIADWALGLAADDEADQVETHLFGCDACSATAQRLLELSQLVGELTRAGALRFALTPALLDCLAADALPLRHYQISPGQTVPCSADAELRYAITHCAADLRGIARVDIRVLGPDGSVIEIVHDVPFAPRAGAVVFAETGDAVRRWPSMRITVELTGFDAAGTERLCARYMLQHSAA